MNSIVAFFDILGYKSFLAGNDAIKSAHQVFDRIVESVGHASSTYSYDDGNGYAIKLSQTVISDSIIVSTEIGPPEGPIFNLGAAVVVAAASSSLCRKMFDFGLPIRGGIEIGPFLQRENMIAGQAVVDAHLLADSLNFSGVAASPRFSDYVDRGLENAKRQTGNESELRSFFESCFPHFLCPLKSGSESILRIAQWTQDKHYEADSVAQVRKAFWAWGKSIPRSVDEKITNTAKTIDYFKLMRRGGGLTD